MPEVSVIVPVYQSEEYIERCARSLFGQTLKDLELIFVDDGSTDRSVRIIEKVLEEYPERCAQTHIIRLGHAGVSACRKAGIEAATGDFLAGCDSDDWAEADMYSRMLDLARAGRHDVIVCDFIRECNGKASRKEQPESGDAVGDILTGKLCPAVWNKLISKDLFKDDFVLLDAGTNEDTLICVQTMSRAGSIGFLHEAPYHYCRHGRSMMSRNARQDIVRKWEESRVNAQAAIAFLEATGLAESHSSAIRQYKFRVRNSLAPLLLGQEHYRQWRETFPEIDKGFLLDGSIPFEVRCKYILSWLRVEPVYRKIYRLIIRNK